MLEGWEHRPGRVTLTGGTKLYDLEGDFLREVANSRTIPMLAVTQDDVYILIIDPVRLRVATVKKAAVSDTIVEDEYDKTIVELALDTILDDMLDRIIERIESRK